MNVVIISTISDDGKLMEQYLVKQEEGMKRFLDVLRMYEDRGFIIHGGYIGDDYENGQVLVERDDCKLTVYVREREVMSTIPSPKSAWDDFCPTEG